MIVAWNRMLAEEVTGSGWTCFSVNGSEALGVFTLACNPQRHPFPERPHLPRLKPCSFKQYPPFHPPPNPGKPPFLYLLSLSVLLFSVPRISGMYSICLSVLAALIYLYVFKAHHAVVSVSASLLFKAN